VCSGIEWLQDSLEYAQGDLEYLVWMIEALNPADGLALDWPQLEYFNYP
jgi:hypothetical protein